MRNCWRPDISRREEKRNVENLDTVRPAPGFGGAGRFSLHSSVAYPLHSVEHKSLQLDRRPEAGENFGTHREQRIRLSRTAREGRAVFRGGRLRLQSDRLPHQLQQLASVRRWSAGDDKHGIAKF